MPIGDRKLSTDELARIAPAEYKAMVKRPIRVVLDDVRSRHNVGSIFRTADALGLEGLVLCGFTPCPPHREIEKTALGATLSVPWEHRPTALDALTHLRAEGYRVLCVEQTAQALPLAALRRGSNEKLALVFGNELNGVSEAAIQACDGCLMIPQEGTKHSLNIAVCAGITLWWVAAGGA